MHDRNAVTDALTLQQVITHDKLIVDFAARFKDKRKNALRHKCCWSVLRICNCPGIVVGQGPSTFAIIRDSTGSRTYQQSIRRSLELGEFNCGTPSEQIKDSYLIICDFFLGM